MFPFKKLPAYGWSAAFLMLGTNCLVYYGSRLLNTSWRHYDFSCGLDHRIPFIGAFVIVYMLLAYFQWICGFYFAVKEERHICRRICISEVTAKLLCLVCFLVIPTTMTRETITGTDLFSRCLLMVYEIDPADNLLPSVHCLESYLLARVLPWMKDVPEWYKKFTIPATVLVMLSTLFVKQHVIADVIAAVLVVEAGIAVSGIITSRLEELK